MKTLSRLHKLPLLVFLPLFLSCQKPVQENDRSEQDTIVLKPIGSSKSQPGLGPNEGMPLGIDLQLPSCIKIVDRPNYRFAPDATKLYGSSSAFYVPISFVNTCCSGNVEVSLPPGMMITSDYGEIQNGLLVENVYFTVPPSYCDGKSDTTTIYLAVACLNENRTPPISRYTADYNVGDFGFKVGKVTNDPNLLMFLELLKDIPGIKTKEFYTNNPEEEPNSAVFRIQNDIQKALWKITDGEGLTLNEVKELVAKLKAFK